MSPSSPTAFELALNHKDRHRVLYPIPIRISSSTCYLQIDHNKLEERRVSGGGISHPHIHDEQLFDLLDTRFRVPPFSRISCLLFWFRCICIKPESSALRQRLITSGRMGKSGWSLDMMLFCFASCSSRWKPSRWSLVLFVGNASDLLLLSFLPSSFSSCNTLLLVSHCLLASSHQFIRLFFAIRLVVDFSAFYLKLNPCPHHNCAFFPGSMTSKRLATKKSQIMITHFQDTERSIQALICSEKIYTKNPNPKVSFCDARSLFSKIGDCVKMV